MAEKYRKVRNQTERAPDNEVRITKNKPLRNYVTYVLSQFRERNATEVTLRSMGNTMDKIISVAEIVKYRVKGLYQINSIGTQIFEDVFEPLEEGLDTLRFKRAVQYFTITLTKNEPKEKGVGFQLPIPESEVNENEPAPRFGGQRREGGRGGRREGGERREGGDRRGGNREGGRSEGRGPRTEGEGGERRRGEGGRGRPFRGGSRGGPRGAPRGGRGGYRGEGSELVPTADGRVDVRTREGGEYRGRGGFRGERGRGGFRGERRDDFQPRPYTARPPRNYEGYNPQRGGERRPPRGGPRESTRGGAAP